MNLFKGVDFCPEDSYHIREETAPKCEGKWKSTKYEKIKINKQKKSKTEEIMCNILTRSFSLVEGFH